MPEKRSEPRSRNKSIFATEDEAKSICARLGASHPDRGTHQWIPRQTEQGWQLIKVAVPPPLDTLTTAVQADERPPSADDPRVAQVKNCGPYGAPI